MNKTIKIVLGIFVSVILLSGAFSGGFIVGHIFPAGSRLPIPNNFAPSAPGVSPDEQSSTPSEVQALFVPFWVGALGYFQAREHTCVRLAARGTRNLDTGEEPIQDAAELALVRARARRVMVESLLTAALVTGLTFLTPE